MLGTWAKEGFSGFTVDLMLWLAVTISNLWRISELILSFPILPGVGLWAPNSKDLDEWKKKKNGATLLYFVLKSHIFTCVATQHSLYCTFMLPWFFTVWSRRFSAAVLWFLGDAHLEFFPLDHFGSVLVRILSEAKTKTFKRIFQFVCLLGFWVCSLTMGTSLHRHFALITSIFSALTLLFETTRNLRVE